MAAAIHDLEGVTGKKYIYSQPLPEDEIRGWYTHQEELKTKVEAERVLDELKKELEVSREDALEQGPLMRTSMVEVEHVEYSLDPATGESIATTVRTQKAQQVPTGQMGWKLKAGARLDKKTGKFFRKKTREEAEAAIVPYEIKNPPAWMDTRMAAAINR